MESTAAAVAIAMGGADAGEAFKTLAKHYQKEMKHADSR